MPLTQEVAVSIHPIDWILSYPGWNALALLLPILLGFFGPVGMLLAECECNAAAIWRPPGISEVALRHLSQLPGFATGSSQKEDLRLPFVPRAEKRDLGAIRR